MSKIPLYLGIASIGAGFGISSEIVMFPVGLSTNISGGIIAALLVLMGLDLVYRYRKKRS